MCCVSSTSATPGGASTTPPSGTDEGSFCGRTVRNVAVVLLGALFFPITAVVCSVYAYKDTYNRITENTGEACSSAAMAFVACIPFIGAGMIFSYMTKEQGGGVCAQVTAFFSGLLILPAMIGVGILATKANKSGCEAFQYSVSCFPLLGAGILAKMELDREHY